MGANNPIARAVALTGQSPAAPVHQPATPASDGSGSTVVGRLSHVDATRLWPSDSVFAAWLVDNLDALGEAVDLRLERGSVQNGPRATVVAQRPAGGPVAIVCERDAATDEAFGSLIRHVAASGAEHGIWVCGSAGDQHSASVSWLNRSVDGRFIMVKVSGVTIGDSAAAPMFEVAVRSPRVDDPWVESTIPSADAVAGSTRRAEDWVHQSGGDDQAS